jgi:hypothetical protein
VLVLVLWLASAAYLSAFVVQLVLSRLCLRLRGWFLALACLCRLCFNDLARFVPLRVVLFPLPCLYFMVRLVLRRFVPAPVLLLLLARVAPFRAYTLVAWLVSRRFVLLLRYWVK